MKHSVEYQMHLNSPKWFRIRTDMLRRSGYCCERCGFHGGPLEVHHLTYKNLGNEHPEDLEVLCRPCHKQADYERRQISEDRVLSARLNGWALKKYGPTWSDTLDQDDVREEFEYWLAKRAA